MPSDRILDVVQMLEDHDVAQVSGGEFPCIFDSLSADVYDAHGYAPRLLFAGKRSDGDTVTIYGRDCETTVSVGDTVTSVTDLDGDEWGPFVIEVIRPDGTGDVSMQLRES